MSPAPPSPTGTASTSTGGVVELASEARFARSFAQHARARGTLAGGVATAIRAGQLPIDIGIGYGPHTASTQPARVRAAARSAATML